MELTKAKLGCQMILSIIIMAACVKGTIMIVKKTALAREKEAIAAVESFPDHSEIVHPDTINVEIKGIKYRLICDRDSLISKTTKP